MIQTFHLIRSDEIVHSICMALGVEPGKCSRLIIYLQPNLPAKISVDILLTDDIETKIPNLGSALVELISNDRG